MDELITMSKQEITRLEVWRLKSLCANSPRAKGRLERANQTLQDRLVTEMRLLGISDMAAGNRYLPEFREDYFAWTGLENRD